MAKQITFDPGEFCLKLLTAETEEEVANIVRKYGYWDDRSVWKPYGDMPNNRSIVGNQQSSSVAALTPVLAVQVGDQSFDGDGRFRNGIVGNYREI